MGPFVKMTLSSLACLAVLGCARALPPAQEAEPAPVRIGVYDSRAVAVAYAGSTFNRDYHSKLRQRHDEAEAAGDREGMAEIHAEGEARQRLFHMQGFSTAPVDEYLAHISDDIAEIRQNTGVDLLVSKWDKETLARHWSAERVDVTMMLVDAFRPDAKTRRTAVEIQGHKPISLRRAENIRD